MASFNRVVLMGNVTRNPEVRSIPGSNTAVARTGLAVNRKYKDKEEVMFIDIISFGRAAEIMGEYLTKGALVQIEGRLSQNVWEKDGVKYSKHEVVIDGLQMLGSKPKNEEGTGQNNSSKPGKSKYDNNGNYAHIDENDVPF